MLMKNIIRIAKKSDIPLLVMHRKLMFLEMKKLQKKIVNKALLQRMSDQYTLFLKKYLGKGTFGIIVEQNGIPASSGAASMMGPWPPMIPVTKEYFSGYIYSIYTEISNRKQGLARLVMKAINKQLKARGASMATLYASNAGVPLYKSLGFITKSNWMTLEMN